MMTLDYVEKVVNTLTYQRHRIAELARKTKRNKKEYGFFLCEHEGDIFIAEECKGSECNIELKRCKVGRPIASFHTHPPGSPKYPSASDVLHSMHAQEQMFCVGDPEGKVRCYEPNISMELLYLHKRYEMFGQKNATEYLHWHLEEDDEKILKKVLFFNAKTGDEFEE